VERPHQKTDVLLHSPAGRNAQRGRGGTGGGGD